MASNQEPMAPAAKPGLNKLKMEVANETLGRDMKQTIDGSNYESALDEKKWEVAEDLGLKEKVEQVGWENMTTKEVGKIGGHMGGKIGGNMVKKMIEMAESQMAPVDKDVKEASRHILEKRT
jgi:hypothetical protein